MKFKDLHRNIKVRIIETYLSSFVGGMIFPFITIYLNKNFDVKMTGIVLIIGTVLGMFASLLSGYFSDQFGRKKFLLFAESIKFIAFASMAISNSPFFESSIVTALMLLVNNIGWGLSVPVNQAMLIDVSAPEQRKYMYSITYWANNFAIAIGGVLGGFLFSDYLFQLLIALSIVSGIDIVIIIFFITESYKPTTKKLQPTKHLLNLTKNYKMVVKDRIFIFFVLGGVLIYSMELQLTNYIGIKISNNIHEQQYFNWTLDGVNVLGILRSENTILAVIFILVIPSLIKLVKDKILLIISCTVFSIGYGIISYSNNISTLIIIMSITTLAEVLRVPIEKSYLAAIPPDDGRSTYMAIAGLKHNFSMLIVSMTVILPSYFSNLSITFIITFIGLIGTFIYFLTIPMIEKRSE